MGELICRDNLEVLCEWYSQGKREFIDLIYIDPPFGNNIDKEWDLKWNRVEDYTNWMYPRVFLMRELLKPTGSFYYHCDPTASHYIKMMLDMIFGMDNFRNEVIWSYKSGGVSKKYFSKKHDTLFFYSKTDKYNFNQQKERTYKYGGIGKSSLQEYFKDEDGNEFCLVGQTDVFNDIGIISTHNKTERLGYPTQKPEKLLERIILSSSNPGDLVVDFYLGGGTTIAVAEKLDRNWIGIDINPRAIEISKKRIEEQK